MCRIVVKLRRFFLQHSAFSQFWFLPVWIALGLAKLAIFTISFRRLVPRLGVSVGPKPLVPLVELAQEKRARQISSVVQLAARYTPWESNCFPQAVVARVLLGAYGVPYCLFFGLRRKATNGEFDAHAWVAAGPVRVTGKSSFQHYTVVGVFTAPALARQLQQAQKPQPGTRNPEPGTGIP